MTEIQDYASRFNDPESSKYGTFSYLPKMDAKRIRQQVAYIVEQGWNPAIEHVEPERAAVDYWYMWKLPMFGLKDVDHILEEAAACHRANPGNHVRIVGYDNFKQSQGTNFVIYRGDAK